MASLVGMSTISLITNILQAL